MLIAIMIAALVAASAVAEANGWSAAEADGQRLIAARSQFSLAAAWRLLEEAPRLILQFPPIWQMLIMIVGVAIAEGSGLFQALARQLIAVVPSRLLTPALFLLGVLGHQIGDASLLVLPPLAARAFVQAGRHPLAGIAVAYAGISGALAANLIPGQHDVMILSFTAAAAQLVEPLRQVSPLANWWFTAAVGAVFTPIAWWITDRHLEPRLQRQAPSWAETAAAPAEAKGLRTRIAVRRALLAMLAVLAVLAAAMMLPGVNGRTSSSALLVGGLMLILLAGGCVFGVSAGTIRSIQEAAAMVASGLFALRTFLLTAALAALFVALLAWSNLALLIPGSVAAMLEPLRSAPLLALLVVAGSAALLDLLIPSASAKWAVLAPLVVPSLMFLDIAPEMTTAAYRLGDSVFNVVLPTSASFALILTLSRRWVLETGVASLIGMMLPYSVAFAAAGTALLGVWIGLGLPLGPTS